MLNDFMKAVLSIIYEEGYYRNSQHVYRGFTIAFNQSDSWTRPCHVRILFKIYWSAVLSVGDQAKIYGLHSCKKKHKKQQVLDIQI